MTSGDGHRVLSREQLDAAVAMLREEREAHPLSPRQRKLFRYYEWSIWAFVSSLASSLVAMTLLPQLSGDSEVLLAVSVAIFVLGSMLFCVVMFVLNVKVLWQTLRELRVAIRARLWRFTAPDSNRPAWMRRLLWVPKAYLLLIAAGGLGGMVYAGWLGVIMALALATYFFLHFARRRLALLDDAERLARTLAELQNREGTGSAAGVSLPIDVFQAVGRVEDMHIERRRAEALAGFDERSAGYALIRSRQLVEQLREAESTVRLRIEQCIAGLADKVPEDKASNAEAGVEAIQIPEIGRTLIFRRDPEKQCIELLHLDESQLGGIAAEVSRV